jgi:ferredoxin-NADP reductase
VSSVTPAIEATVPAPRPLTWLIAEVAQVIDETPRVRSLRLRIPGWGGHLPGQHLDVRLTGEDGYQAQRSYSIASSPQEELVELTVQRLEDGEVSPYLTQGVATGDAFQVRGPIGYHFVWTADRGGPLFLIAGGSGIAPLMAMLRHRRAADSNVPTVLLYSSRSADDIIYRRELEDLAAVGGGLRVVHTLTDRQPPGWMGETRRIDRAMIGKVGFGSAMRPRVFICGPTGLVEAAARILVEAGHDPALVKTERFGPTGV